MSLLKPWRVTGTRTLYRDPFVTLTGEDCVADDGRPLGQYHLLEYRDWVHVVAIDTEEHLILVRQYRHGLGAMSLELPGGIIDATDTDPQAAAARELAEETGYRSEHLTLLPPVTPNAASHRNRLFTVVAEDVVHHGPQRLDPAENIEIVRLPISEAVQLALSGGIPHAMHVAALVMGLQVTGRLKASLA